MRPGTDSASAVDELKQPLQFLTCAAAHRTVKPTVLILLVMSTVWLSGCVQRRMIIRSQPEGALVSIDNQQVGQTPVPVPFTYYGTRQIQLQKEGFKTVKVEERIRPKWYDRAPISFFSNHFAFREIRDERILDFQLEPQSQVEENILMDRANELRLNVHRDTLIAPDGGPF